MNHIREQPKFVDTPWIRQRDMERLDQVARQVEGMFSAGFMEVTQGTGIQIAVMPDTGLWGQITDQNPDDTDPDPPQFFYSFVELMPYDNEYAASVSAQWVEKPGGVQQAYNGRLPAREVQGRTDVPAGTIVRLWLADSGDHYHFRYDGPGTSSQRGVVGGNIIDTFDDAVANCECSGTAGALNEQWICFEVTYEDFLAFNAETGDLTLFTVGAGRKFDVISYTFRGINHFQLPYYTTGTSTVPNTIAYDEVTFTSTELGIVAGVQSLAYNDDLVPDFGTYGSAIYSLDGDNPAADSVSITATIDPGGNGQTLEELLCGKFEICVLLRDVAGEEPPGLDADGEEDANVPAGQQAGSLTVTLTAPTYEYSDQVEASYGGAGEWGWEYTNASVYVETLMAGYAMPDGTQFEILFKGWNFSELPDCATITSMTVNYEVRQSATTGDITAVEAPAEIVTGLWDDNSNPGFPDMPQLGWFLSETEVSLGTGTAVGTNWLAVSRTYTSFGTTAPGTSVTGPYGDIFKSADFGVMISTHIKVGDNVSTAYSNVEIRNVTITLDYYAPVAEA